MDHLTLTAGSYQFVFADDFLTVLSETTQRHNHYDLRAISDMSVKWGEHAATIYLDGTPITSSGMGTKDESYEVARNVVDRWKHARRVLLSPQK